MYPAEASHLCTCIITPDELEKRLSELDGDVDGVYITSPDYLGRISDIKGLSEVCGRYSVPLLVDNAHGAYLRFLESSEHPINNGAYMCCDSAHKTLPVLTGGAYLHLSEAASGLSGCIENMMALMGSTSPSYLILQSLDLCNRYLSDGYKERLATIINRIEALKKELESFGVVVKASEPLKLVIGLNESGVLLDSILSALKANNIMAEFYDKENVVFMFTPENTERDFSALLSALLSVSYGNHIDSDGFAFSFANAERILSIKEAVFSAKEIIRVEDAEGRICASPAIICPPAVPPVVSGELISKAAIDCMLHYGIEKIEVVK
jgi:arginine/lysine/ornithine decarboxylase